jgi:hypothetical protein
VADTLDKFGISDLNPLPEEYEQYLDIPFSEISDMMSEELHLRMACLTHQRNYLDNLVGNAQIEVNQLERDFTKTWHDNYEGQNKKMNAEKQQLDSGVWEELDVAKGILMRVTSERERLESNYRFFSRVLSSRQGGH